MIIRPGATGVMHPPRREVLERLTKAFAEILDKAVERDKATRREMTTALQLCEQMVNLNDPSRGGSNGIR